MEQYYTPAIEDIRIGYECELFLPTSDWWKPDTWTKFKISENGYSHTGPNGGDLSEIGDVCNMINLNQVRTPYLTKEQIETEGWVEQNGPGFIVAISYEFNRIPFSKGDYRLDYNYELQILAISKFDAIRYYGKCPSINELRVICKLLNI